MVIWARPDIGRMVSRTPISNVAAPAYPGVANRATASKHVISNLLILLFFFYPIFLW